MQGIKHYIECHCTTPQYRNAKKPIYFGFVVFSVVDDGSNVESKFVQCPNCGVIHKVYDICKSEIMLGKEESRACRTISDVKRGLPKSLTEILDESRCELADYEKLEWIIDNSLWEETLIISTDLEKDGTRVGKLLKFSKEGKPRIEPFMSTELIE